MASIITVELLSLRWKRGSEWPDTTFISRIHGLLIFSQHYLMTSRYFIIPDPDEAGAEAAPGG